jgi:hypothetical protein
VERPPSVDRRVRDQGDEVISHRVCPVSDGEVHRETTSIRIYTYRELAEQLEGVGFTELQDFGSLTKEAFTINSERLYLIARKPT